MKIALFALALCLVPLIGRAEGNLGDGAAVFEGLYGPPKQETAYQRDIKVLTFELPHATVLTITFFHDMACELSFKKRGPNGFTAFLIDEAEAILKRYAADPADWISVSDASLPMWQNRKNGNEAALMNYRKRLVISSPNNPAVQDELNKQLEMLDLKEKMKNQPGGPVPSLTPLPPQKPTR